MSRPRTDGSPSTNRPVTPESPAPAERRLVRGDDRAVAPATMIGLMLFVSVVLGGILALTVVTA